MDMPYGHDIADWDSAATTPAQLKQILKEEQSINTNDKPRVFIGWCDRTMRHQYEKVFPQVNWNGFATISWVKPNVNLKGVKRFMPSTEHGFVAFRPNQSSVDWQYDDPNPLKRPDFVVMNHVPECDKVKDQEGKVVNPCEKPTGLFRHWMQMFAKAGQWVLIIGFGSGSEVVAAVRMGLNVVCLESDKRQFDLLPSRLESLRIELNRPKHDIIDDRTGMPVSQDVLEGKVELKSAPVVDVLESAECVQCCSSRSIFEDPTRSQKIRCPAAECQAVFHLGCGFYAAGGEAKSDLSRPLFVCSEECAMPPESTDEAQLPESVSAPDPAPAPPDPVLE